MTFQSYRLRTIPRLSLCSVLFAFVVQVLAWSVMPVSAQGRSSADGWLVICTSDGFKRISLTEAGITPASSHSDTNSPPILVDHCDLCVFAFGLGMGPAPAQALEDERVVRVGRSYTANRVGSGKIHTPQQPRAPPVSWLI